MKLDILLPPASAHLPDNDQAPPGVGSVEPEEIRRPKRNMKNTTPEPDFQSQHYAVGFSDIRPAFTWFTVDSLGHGKRTENPVLEHEGNPVASGLKREAKFTYTRNGKTAWSVECQEKALTMRSNCVEGAEALPFSLAFNQKKNHATLLGLMEVGKRSVSLPCILHLPDMGSVRITCSIPDAELEYDARRMNVPVPFVEIVFPSATGDTGCVEYLMEVVAIHPPLPGVGSDPLYDGFRRGWLNVFQVNPRLQMLANNAASDACTFTLFIYALMARHTPPLTAGLGCSDLIRMTLDRYISGAKGYGQVGYACEPTDADLIPWITPWTSLDSLPSLLLAACDYVGGSDDVSWARTNYERLVCWAYEMLAGDRDGDGLLEYPGTGNFGDRPLRERRPSNWWDTINFGHKDAFSNALAYRACHEFGQLAGRLGHAEDAKWLAEKAALLRSAYVPAFLNPETGVLAGWKSADGQLHDYWFTFVQGVAITCGLLDDQTANSVMDRLLTKMQEVGYTNFSLGLPGNLVPVKKGDYVYHGSPPEMHGEPLLDDGSDGFQFYENGGATGCWAYFMLKALYRLGRTADARRILHPMLAGYAAGEFQGFDASGMSRDWRDWHGGCHGYEGLLVDNYLTLLAVLDDVKEASDARMAAGENPSHTAAGKK